ncbi:MAG: HdeD family acid-resistance protein [Thiohalospira sp.]
MENLKNWLLISLPGILAILFGIVALAFPSITIFALVIYFAISIIVSGGILVFLSLKFKNKKPNWALTLFEGIVGILFGIIILSKPELTAIVLITIIGIWSLFIGFFFTSSYFVKSVPKEIRYIYLFAGLISLLFGLLIVLNPFEGPRAVIILIGLYSISYGIFSIINNSKKY